MDRITQEANPDPHELNELLFADDQCIKYHNSQDLQEHTDKLNAACQHQHFENIDHANQPRSKETGYPHQQYHHPAINRFQIPGQHILRRWGKEQIETRYQKVINITYLLGSLLSHPAVPMEAKRTIFNSKHIIYSNPFLQSQTWAMNRKMEKKITTGEMKCLRRAANKTRRGEIRNEVIRYCGHQTPVGISGTAAHQLVWASLAHGPKSTCTESVQQPIGPKPRERPRRRWFEGGKQTLAQQNIDMTDATHAVQERRLHISPRL